MHSPPDALDDSRAAAAFKAFLALEPTLKEGFFLLELLLLFIFSSHFWWQTQCSLLVVVVAKYRARAKVKKTREREDFKGGVF